MSDQPQDTTAATGAGEVELFDPAAHNVAEVNDHLAASDPDEVARVLSAEAEAETPRKGIVEGPHVAVVEAATVEDLLGEQNPYEVVRAKDAQGNEYSTTRIAALNAGSTVLEKPALDQWGQIVPTKTVLDFRAEATDTTITEEN